MDKMKIVIVDDEPINLILLEEMSKNEGNTPITFLNPMEALEHIKSSTVDLLICDYNMPQMDGITLIKECSEIYPDLLSVMITANNEENVRIEALNEGVIDFLTKPLNPAEFMLRMRNILRIRKAMLIEREFSTQLKEQVEIATKTIKDGEMEALQILSKTAEYKDPETATHVARVAHYSKLLGQLLGFNEEEQELLYYGAPLHDIGKVGIADDILLKPGKLTEDEFTKMKLHSNIGYSILENVQNPYLRAGAIIAQSHHEKYDGTGYPKGQKGEEIPIYGRIVAIADVFDALTSIRPYKRAWSFEDAMQFIEDQKGYHFDPKIADLFISAVKEIEEIYRRFGGE